MVKASTSAPCRGGLVSAEQGNTDGNNTWYHFLIRPDMCIMTLNQDSRIFRKQSVLKTGKRSQIVPTVDKSGL
ncbi:TPA: hypothetical protein KV183_001794 [Morganella morganii]|uniref:Uncharacterized protein n=1 Tax=Morganella morganii TaxID=582 RepID=A0AAN5S0G2_MORMO|nr:phage late control D family protein [Morganella morganii]HAT3809666.1 hypothetical protein [Morganella morganii]HBH7052362.1 hypothetical protein [Morganella morganii]HED3890055.1 hypothetical protein [Morganella morganii]HEI9844275.1 hypothetical protein [Morganella morganii]